MLKKILLVPAFLLIVLGQTGATSNRQESEITIFIAASTTDVITTLNELFFEKQGITVKTNPASSGTLAHQIEQGAMPDVYISASKKWMEYVKALGVVGESAPFVKNSLVLISPGNSPLAPFELTKETDFPGLFEGRLSMGDPAHVPAGKYAEEALQYFGWYDELSGRLQLATDVRAALLVVEMGETETGIVYETDAMKSQRVRILSRFPVESHAPIEYFCALLSESDSDAGKLYYDFLLNKEEVSDIYKQYGFTPVE